MFNMLIQCSSLGEPPIDKNIQNCFLVEKKKTPIEHIIGWTAECAGKNGGIKNLLIACHGGYENGSPHKELGGQGINLGTGLNQESVVLTKAWKGLVKNIYIYACGGAYEPKGADTDATLPNNRLTCILMSQYTGCPVYAAKSLQAYNWFGRLDFGSWEGMVEKFEYIQRGNGQSPVVRASNVTSRMHDFGRETGDE